MGASPGLHIIEAETRIANFRKRALEIILKPGDLAPLLHEATLMNHFLSADEIIAKLNLKPLPDEGGFYRETYRSDLSTAIYYLITKDNFSALHRLKSDEVFHFYAGDAVEMIQIDSNNHLTKITVENDIISGHTPQVLVPRGVWQGLRLAEGGQWALMGTTVAPGFEFKDFELAQPREMTRELPQYTSVISKYTR